MSDLIKRLRDYAEWSSTRAPNAAIKFHICNEAAAALEAKDRRIAELEAGIAEQLAPAACEWKERAERAEQRIVELEAYSLRGWDENARLQAELAAVRVENAELRQLICGVAAAIEFDPEWDGPDADRIREIAAQTEGEGHGKDRLPAQEPGSEAGPGGQG